jgi:predicted PurR-regulated permease PerM
MSSPDQRVTVDITSRTVVRVIFIAIAAFLLLTLLGRLSHIITLIAVSIFLALALNPAVSWIAVRLKTKGRGLATGLAYVAVLTVLILFLSFVIPPLVRQTADFISEVPQTIDSLRTQDSTVGRFVRQHRLDEQLQEVSRDISKQVPELRGQILSVLSRAGATMVSVVTVLVMTFMMLVEGPAWIRKFWSYQPKRRRERGQRLASGMYGMVTGYVNGQLLITTIAGFFALIMLLITSTVMNVSVNAVALAGIIAMTGLIPMIGNTIGAAVVVLACLFVSLPLAVVVGIYFLIYQQIENTAIQPYIQSKKNNLTPLLVFISALIGIGVAGFFGAFVAIPVASSIKLLIEDYLENRSDSQKAN